MNKILFSFGNWHYYVTLQMLKKSVTANGNINESYMFKESDIDTSFYAENRNHFKDGRGFGYWIWKSYFINKFLATAPYNDVFFYVDAGNEVMGDLSPLYEQCQKDEKGIILFENTDGEPTGNVWKNEQWTKSDTFNIMGMKSPEYLQGDQVNASYILFRKTDFSVSFFRMFGDWCKNYNIISDAANVTENFNTVFRDHRHDQSVLSLLSIQHKITIMRDPSQWGNHRPGQKDLYGQLFHHHRRNYYL